MDDGLIKAAATDPGVLLPDCILDYMVPKGIFRSQGTPRHHSDTEDSIILGLRHCPG
jgi:hypothetical protein